MILTLVEWFTSQINSRVYMKEKRIKDAYEFYKTNTENPLGYSMYVKIAEGYTNFIMEKVMDGNDVQLGARLGTIAIRGKKVRPVINCRGEIKGVAPSWGKTRKMWMEKADALGISLEEYIANTPKEERGMIYCFNEHTNGIRYSLVWIKRNVYVPNKDYYTLTFVRSVKRAVRDAANSGKEYLVTEERTTESERQLARERAEAVAEQITGLKLKTDTQWLD